MTTLRDEYQNFAQINLRFNDYVTEFCHGRHGIHISPSQKKFLKIAYDINSLEQRLWSFLNFRFMKQDYFRKTIQRLSPIIEKVIPGRPCFYRLRGIFMPYCVTKTPTGVYPREIDPEFDRILEGLKTQPPMMHDIRVGTRISKLHENLLGKGLFPNPYNYCFSIYIPQISRFELWANVYRESMQIMIGCSYEPLPYNLNGFLELTALLGQICDYLELLGGSKFYHQPFPEWNIQYLHLNRDGVEINGNKFSYSISDLSNHSVFYLKKFKDGQLRPRYEEHRSPNQTIQEITELM